MLDDELTLPFIFVADGADPPPELAEFRSAHPDWVSFPATFIPHERPVQEREEFRAQTASDDVSLLPPHKRPKPPQPTRTDLGAAPRAFQRASAEHADPVAALRALRDRPEDFADGSSASILTPPLSQPGFLPRTEGTGHEDIDSQPLEPLNAKSAIWQNETLANRQHSYPTGESGDKYPSLPSRLIAPPVGPNGAASGQSDQPSAFRLAAGNSDPAIGALPDDDNIQVVADDGTPGNNQVQNAQVRAVVRILGLSRDQREQLHREISGQDYSFQQILEAAKDMFGK